MYEITLIKGNTTSIHTYKPPTKDEALRVGHELCRDGVAHYFRIDEEDSPEEHEAKLAWVESGGNLGE